MPYFQIHKTDSTETSLLSIFENISTNNIIFINLTNFIIPYRYLCECKLIVCDNLSFDLVEQEMKGRVILVNLKVDRFMLQYCKIYANRNQIFVKCYLESDEFEKHRD